MLAHDALKPLTKTRLHEEIVEQAMGRIVSGDWKAGSRLPPERELAEQLGVNRTTLREALHKLESMGLVDIRHGNGVFVRDYLESGSLELARHLLVAGGPAQEGALRNLQGLRRILVPEISALAATNRSDAELQELERVVFHSPDMPIEEQDWRVHNVLARASGNLLFVIILNAFTDVTRDASRAYFEAEEHRRRSRRFHREILAVVEQQDPARARQVMATVLAYVERQTTST